MSGRSRSRVVRFIIVLSACLQISGSQSSDQSCLQTPPDSECTSGFSMDIATTDGGIDHESVLGRQYLFPNINFTCEGRVTGICFKGSEIFVGGMRHAEIQIWRKKGTTSCTCYEKVMDSSTSLGPRDTCNENICFVKIEVKPNDRRKLHFKNGDVLGIYLPRIRNGAGLGNQPGIVPHFVTGNMPGYFVKANTSPMELNLTLLPMEEIVPNIMIEVRNAGVEMSSDASDNTVPTAPVPPVSTHISPAPTLPSVTDLGTNNGAGGSESDRPAPTLPSVTNLGSNSEAGGSRSDSDSSGLIAGVMGTVSVVMLGTMALLVFLVIIIYQRRWRKRNREHKQRSLNSSDNQLQLANPVYTGEVSGRYQGGSDALANSAEPARGGTMASDYEELLTQSGQRAPDYQLIDDDLSVPMPGSNPTYHVLEHSPDQTTLFNDGINPAPHYEGIYVPTGNQRRMLNSNVGVGVYSTLAGEQQVSVFFEETGTYWRPASRADEIYEQLAAKKYREISRKHIQITDHLGSGQYGTVHKGIWQSEGGAKEVAVKMLKAGSLEDDKVRFLQEAAINGQFRHTNVVRLMGVVTLDEPVMIVLELLKNGDLRQYLIKMRPTPGEMVPSELPQTLLGFCREIAAGMAYLSRKGFVHRDLAARNILVAEDKKCKISDFGMSRDLEDTDYYVSQGGKVPVKWTAPEALHYKKYTSSSDVWSYGVVLYEIWSLGHKPFEGYTNTETIQMMDDNFRLPPPPGCPRAIYKMMIDCWHPDRLSRPTFEQLGEDLSEPETELLVWMEEDAQSHPLATTIGAALEAGQDLYTDLQQKYKTS